MSQFELTIERWAWPSQGLGHHQGKAVFVGAVLPGERVLVESIKSGKNHLEARLVQVLEAAPNRIKPKCPHFPTCGGCSLLHLSHQDQLDLKLDLVKEQLNRQRLACAPKLISSPAVWGTRHRASLKTTQGQLGLHRYRSPQVLPILECPVFSPGIQQALKAVKPAPSGELLALESHHYPQTALAWEHKSKQRPQPGYGQQITESYGFGDLQLDVGLFAQSNPEVVRLILATIQQMAQPFEVICEHYAGSGTLSHVLAQGAKQYQGYEANPKATKRGNQNLKALQIDTGGIKKEKAEQASLPPDTELLVVDPPRAGMAKELIEALCASKTSTLLYLSCNLQTQTRDLRYLVERGQFQLKEFTSFEMYPHTGHQETLAWLQR